MRRHLKYPGRHPQVNWSRFSVNGDEITAKRGRFMATADQFTMKRAVHDEPGPFHHEPTFPRVDEGANLA